jgi:hypothetical protein
MGYFELWGGFLGFFFLYKKDKTFKPWLKFYILFVLRLMLDYTKLAILVELMVFVMVLYGLKIHKQKQERKEQRC